MVNRSPGLAFIRKEESNAKLALDRFQLRRKFANQNQSLARLKAIVPDGPSVLAPTVVLTESLVRPTKSDDDTAPIDANVPP